MLSTQLYTKKRNPVDRGGDYGWAALRAITLNALSMQGSNALSLQAAEELLTLLSEISPKVPDDGSSGEENTSQVSPRVRRESAKASTEHRIIGQSSGHGKPPSKVDVSEPVATASTFAKQLRDSFTTMTAGSVIAMESKWADNEAIKPLDVPLAQSSEAFASTQAMGCVWQGIDFDRCSSAQKKAIERIMKLRRALPTPSIDQKQSGRSVDTASLPLYVSSALNILPEPSLELENMKKAKKQDVESKGAMATFYNPFDKRAVKEKITIIAAGEERAMSVEFNNRLAVPLTVQRCQLEFENEGTGQIKATPIAFTLPPKASAFAVHFPFSVLSSSTESGDETVFEVQGISLTLLGRVFFLPFASSEQAAREHSKLSKEQNQKLERPRFEICSSQPRLQVHFTKSGAPVDPDKPVPVSLADGQLLPLPSLRLKNWPGPCGRGALERLQILAVDLPGLPDHKLFDSEEDVPILGEEEFTHSLINDDKSPPLKIQALAPSRKFLEEVNDNNCPGSLVTFQIGASHSMKRQLRKGAIIKIRFRYRGASTSISDFWRKREVLLRVVCIDGPRISSMDFRPDLEANSAYSDMCRSLSLRQTAELNIDTGSGNDSEDAALGNVPSLSRIGMDPGVNIASKEVTFVLTVANESTSEVTLHREGAPNVGGFPGSPLDTIQVHPGVSAKFPIVIPRIPRFKDDGSDVDLAKEVVELTKLRWETHCGSASQIDGDDEGSSIKAKGSVRIPIKPLMQIIEEHPSFVSKICEPPCEILLYAGGKRQSAESSKTATAVQLGKATEISAQVTSASWVPSDVLWKCKLTLEFFCARDATSSGNDHDCGKDFVWCGKLRQEFAMDGRESMKHRIKIAFVKPGTYSLSACARIRHEGKHATHGDAEEIWWAPVAATVLVEKARCSPSQ